MQNTAPRLKSGQLWIIGLIIFALIYPLVDGILAAPFRLTSLMPYVIPTVIFTLLALGLNVVVGYAGLLDLGYVAFFAIGAYTVGILSSLQSPIGRWLAAQGIQIPFWILFLLGGPVAALFGILLGAPTLRLRGDYLAIVTLGFGEIVPVFFRNIDTWTNGIQGISPIPRPIIDLTGFNIPFKFVASFDDRPWYYISIILTGISIFLMLRLRDSRIGRAWLAIREDELAAAAMGIDPVRTKLLAFALGATFAGYAGGFWSSYLQLVSPDMFQFGTSVILLAMVILGGMGNVWGVLVGGFAIMLVDRVLLPQLSQIVQEFGRNANLSTLAEADFGSARWLLFGAALVIMMLVRPQGMIPEPRVGAMMTTKKDEPTARPDNQRVVVDAPAE